MANEQNVNGNGWSYSHTLLVLVFLGLMLLAGYLIPGRLLAWALILLLLIVSLIVIGHGQSGLIRGILIDERNKISLSRLQMVAWTVLVLSAFMTAGLGNIRVFQSAWNAFESSQAAGEDVSFAMALVSVTGVETVTDLPLEVEGIEEITLFEALGEALSIAVPSELWVLIGISVTSLLGTPLIRSNKTKPPAMDAELLQKENEAAVKQQARLQGIPADQADKHIAVEGQVLVNCFPEDSRFGDLFDTEYVGNVVQNDLGKIQNFYFTAILVLVYAALLGATFHTVKIVTELPALSASMLALLGISSATYLASMAMPPNISPIRFEGPEGIQSM